MTMMTDGEIILQVGTVSPLTVCRIRKTIEAKTCDWQKIRVMSDGDLLRFMWKKCPKLTTIFFPETKPFYFPSPGVKAPMQEIWSEYRRASYQ
jgi:hypothetical protein